MKETKNMLWGIILIVLGLIIGLNQLEITQIDLLFDGWWTLFIIIPCTMDLFKEKEKTGNIIGLLIGIALLLCCQDIIDFSLVWKLLLPVVLVIVGISFIFKDSFNQKISTKIKEINGNNTNEECVATFSGQDINYAKQEFNGTNLTAVFGGIKCNLEESKIKKDVVINANCIFGGIEIKAPKDVIVKIKSTSIFGGVEDKRKNKDITDKSKIIYINATCIFGGVEIK